MHVACISLYFSDHVVMELVVAVVQAALDHQPYLLNQTMRYCGNKQMTAQLVYFISLHVSVQLHTGCWALYQQLYRLSWNTSDTCGTGLLHVHQTDGSGIIYVRSHFSSDATGVSSCVGWVVHLRHA